jgi:peroxiredoxin
MRSAPWIALCLVLLGLDGFLVTILKSQNSNIISAKDLGKGISPNNSLLTLIVFFSSKSCDPCLEEATIWQQILQDFDRRQIQFVGVVTDRAEMEALKEKLKIDAPLIIDKKGKLARRYKIRFDPFKILISREGQILYMGSVSPRRITQEDFYYEVVDILRKIEVAEFSYRISNN